MVQHNRSVGSWVIKALGFVSLASTSACFTYVPVPMTSVAPKNEVRVRITNDAGARLVRSLGVYTTQLEGEFETHGDSVSVTVPISREYRGVALEVSNQSLYLGRSEVVEVRQRRFSRSRTILTSAGVVVGFAALVKSIQEIADPNSDKEEPPPPPPVGTRIPLRPITLFRIPLP
jgi:hypothetical protein